MHTSIHNRRDLTAALGTNDIVRYRGLELIITAESVEITAIGGISVSTPKFTLVANEVSHHRAAKEIDKLASLIEGQSAQGVQVEDVARLTGVVSSVAAEIHSRHQSEWDAMNAAGLDVGDERPADWDSLDTEDQEGALAEATAFVLQKLIQPSA